MKRKENKKRKEKERKEKKRKGHSSLKLICFGFVSKYQSL